VIGGIERLSAHNGDIIEGLVSLADKSLVRLSDDSAGQPRLGMLETIREYATDQLKADPEFHHATCQAHATYFAEFAEKHSRRMDGHEREAAMDEMAVDVENLKIAWRYWAAAGELEQLHRMVNALWLLYDRRGWYQATVELTTDLLHILSTTPSSPEQARQEIMLQTSLARALMAIKGYTSEVEEAYKRALKLSEGLGEIPQLFPVLRGLSSYYMYRAEFDKGAQIGQKILELAESRDDDYLRVHGYLVLGANTGFLEGQRAGMEILDKGIELFEREQQRWQPFQLGNNPGIVCYTTSAFFLYWLGFPDRAVHRSDRAVASATALNHPFTLAYALFHTGSLHMWRGEMELVKERAKAMLQVAEAHGFQIWQSLATMLLGAAETALGDLEEGLAKVEQGFAFYQGLKSPPLFYPQLIAIRAAALAQVGRPAQGLALLDELLKDMPEERLLNELPQLLQLKGELMLIASPERVAEATSIFRALLAGAGHMGGKILALQAATGLCQLEMQAGSGDESGRLLQEIYESFTEGFDTADLRRARAVLDAWQDQNAKVAGRP